MTNAMQAVTRRRVATYWAVGLVLSLAYAVTRGSPWQGNADLHTHMEAAATLLALIVGVMALVRFYSKKNNTFLFIGTGFLGTAFLDGYHAVVTSLAFKAHMPSDLSSLIPWSWVASRQFLSILLFLSWLAWLRERRLGEAGRIGERTVYLFTATFTLASFLFFAFVPLPRAYYPEIVFHRPEEFVPALFFLLALFGFLRKGDWKHDPFEHWLVVSLVVGFVSQAVFMSYSGRLFDLEFDAAHTLKKVSYVCVLTGLMVSMYAIFRKAEDTNAKLQIEISERERAEAKLARRARDLERSNAELAQFASVASHDLQEPLRKVQAFGDRLKSKYADAIDEQGRDYITRMQDATNRMQSLIEGLLSIAQVSTRANPFDPVDLNTVGQDVVSDLEARIRETGATVNFSDLPTIDADRIQMRQLFQNLIGNAMKYRRSDTTAVIEVSAELADGETAGPNGAPVDRCRILFKDNGIGFEPQYGDRIFGVFQRLHNRGEYGGSGIGLAICRKIAERHGGTIAAQGQPGKGAAFTVTLPLTQRSMTHE